MKFDDFDAFLDGLPLRSLQKLLSKKLVENSSNINERAKYELLRKNMK